MSQEPHSLDDFGGTVRLFPLPNLVLFPHVAQPLHIFEARYRQMMADALADDRRLAMALLRPGWEEDYHKRPPIHPMVCLGRITQEAQLPDGRYNLILQGLCRARVLEEVDTDRLYRIARVDLCPDVPVSSSQRAEALRRELGQGIEPFFAGQAASLEQMRRLLGSPLSLGQLCDIFAYALPMELEIKQQLLEEVGVQPRVRLLLSSLEGRTPPVTNEPPRRFPPEFSEN